ncbi:hypothetical protein KAR91_34415 [Candidatus Pacearchaeota archaeon]|nr:hypothetical protein [Candidatus Pacearchaeota archaeon]
MSCRIQHPVEIKNLADVLIELRDLANNCLEVLQNILLETKKVNIHLQTGTDEELNDEEIDNVY